VTVVVRASPILSPYMLLTLTMFGFAISIFP
jgi:hypothetical protein